MKPPLGVSEETFELFLKTLHNNQIQKEQIKIKLLELNNEIKKALDQIVAHSPDNSQIKDAADTAIQNIIKNTSLNISDSLYDEWKNALIDKLVNLNNQREFINQSDNLLKANFTENWTKIYETTIARIDNFISQYQTNNPSVTIEKSTGKIFNAGIIRSIKINKRVEINFIEPRYLLGKMTQSMRLQFSLNKEEQFSINVYEDKDNYTNFEIQAMTPHFEDFAINEKGAVSTKFDDYMIGAIEKILYLAHL